MKSYMKTVSKHPKITHFSPEKKPIRVFGESSKKLRPIGTLAGKMSVPTEEEFSKYDLEIQAIFGGEDK
ncbi:hypothetical protein Ppb6_00949 [Photorhabdus australis subsp. thailandensis]|uniref:Uncharacterized protein n=2 Tax=Photorhabdus australis TaxID=286156 RepID=A0A1C0U7N9_9GAMM|nr:hypothetical protein Ppb6_00949 [Photorhabdus australis subsp. thailandensis]